MSPIPFGGWRITPNYDVAKNNSDWYWNMRSGNRWVHIDDLASVGHRVEARLARVVARVAELVGVDGHHAHARSARGGQQHGAHDARQGGGQDDLLDGFGLGRAQPQRAVAHGLGHGVDDVVRQRADEGDQHDPHHEARGHHGGARLHDAQPFVAEDLEQHRPHRQQREQRRSGGVR